LIGLADRERYRPGMQRQLTRLRTAIEGGMPRRGWKVGINVPEVLQKAGLTHSGVGWIDGRRVFESGAELTAPPAARHHEPISCRRMKSISSDSCPSSWRSSARH
jgi:hypothetical protein